MDFKIKVKNLTGWNTINRRRAELILNNCVLSCKGEYSDDYSHDNDINFKRGLSSEDCIKRVKRDLSDSAYSYVKIYWDNKTDCFLFFYGQWLSFEAKPKDDFKIIKEFVKEVSDYPNDVKALKEAMQERTDLYFKQGFENLEPDKVTIKKRSKYWALDVGDSGKWLIDKTNLSVYSIKGYGKKGYNLGTITEIRMKINEDIRTFKELIEGTIKGNYALYF